MTETIIQVRAPYFTAGAIIQSGHCVECAPILRKACLGRSADQMRDVIRRRGWVPWWWGFS